MRSRASSIDFNNQFIAAAATGDVIKVRRLRNIIPTTHHIEALVEASKNNQVETALELLSYGVDINSANQLGETPLAMAKEHGCEQTIQALISNGALDDDSTFGTRYLTRRARASSATMPADLAYNDFAAQLSKNDRGYFNYEEWFFEAVAHKSLDLVNAFLASGNIELDRQNLGMTIGDNALAIAAQSGRTDVILALSEAGLSINRSRGNALACAAISGHKESVQTLLLKNARIDDSSLPLLTKMLATLFDCDTDLTTDTIGGNIAIASQIILSLAQHEATKYEMAKRKGEALAAATIKSGLKITTDPQKIPQMEIDGLRITTNFNARIEDVEGMSKEQKLNGIFAPWCQAAAYARDNYCGFKVAINYTGADEVVRLFFDKINKISVELAAASSDPSTTISAAKAPATITNARAQLK